MNTDLNCMICFDILDNNNNNPIIKIKCGHIFHLSCIETSYKYNKDTKCPYCRKEGGLLNTNTNIKLCKAIIQNGKNKGNICNCKININDSNYCGRHKKLNI